MDKEQVVAHNRTWETVGFISGMLILIAYAIVELYVYLKCHFTDCRAYGAATHWPLLVAGGLLIAPKMIGRAQAGKLIETVLTLRSGKSVVTASVGTQPKTTEPAKPVEGGE